MPSSLREDSRVPEESDKPSDSESDYILGTGSTDQCEKNSDNLQNTERTILKSRELKIDGNNSIHTGICQVVDEEVIPVPSWHAEINCAIISYHQINQKHSSKKFPVPQIREVYNTVVPKANPNLFPRPVLRIATPFKRKKSPKPEKKLHSETQTSFLVRHLFEMNNPINPVKDTQDRSDCCGTISEEDSSCAHTVKDPQRHNKVQDMKIKASINKEAVDSEYRDSSEDSEPVDKERHSRNKSSTQFVPGDEINANIFQYSWTPVVVDCDKNQMKNDIPTDAKNFDKEDQEYRSRNKTTPTAKDISWKRAAEVIVNEKDSNIFENSSVASDASLLDPSKFQSKKENGKIACNSSMMERMIIHKILESKLNQKSQFRKLKLLKQFVMSHDGSSNEEIIASEKSSCSGYGSPCCYDVLAKAAKSEFWVPIDQLPEVFCKVNNNKGEIMKRNFLSAINPRPRYSCAVNSNYYVNWKEVSKPPAEPMNDQRGCLKLVDDTGNEAGKFYIGANGFQKDDDYEVIIELRKKGAPKNDIKEHIEAKDSSKVIQKQITDNIKSKNNAQPSTGKVQSSAKIGSQETKSQGNKQEGNNISSVLRFNKTKHTEDRAVCTSNEFGGIKSTFTSTTSLETPHPLFSIPINLSELMAYLNSKDDEKNKYTSRYSKKFMNQRQTCETQKKLQRLANGSNSPRNSLSKARPNPDPNPHSPCPSPQSYRSCRSPIFVYNSCLKNRPKNFVDSVPNNKTGYCKKVSLVSKPSLRKLAHTHNTTNNKCTNQNKVIKPCLVNGHNRADKKVLSSFIQDFETSKDYIINVPRMIEENLTTALKLLPEIISEQVNDTKHLFGTQSSTPLAKFSRDKTSPCSRDIHANDSKGKSNSFEISNILESDKKEDSTLCHIKKSDLQTSRATEMIYRMETTHLSPPNFSSLNRAKSPQTGEQ